VRRPVARCTHRRRARDTWRRGSLFASSRDGARRRHRSCATERACRGTFLGRGMSETPNICIRELQHYAPITGGKPTTCWALILPVRALQPGGHRFDPDTLH
jgi:hypothetical protein